MKTLIATKGKANSGKTTLMWTVYERLVSMINNKPHKVWTAQGYNEIDTPHSRVYKASGLLDDFSALLNINGVKIYIASAGDVESYLNHHINKGTSFADIVLITVRIRTKSQIIKVEKFYETKIKPVYSPIEFVSCKYNDSQKISEQNDQLADEIVSAIMKEVQKITNL